MCAGENGFIVIGGEPTSVAVISDHGEVTAFKSFEATDFATCATFIRSRQLLAMGTQEGRLNALV